jgi:hypothetical protein
MNTHPRPFRTLLSALLLAASLPVPAPAQPAPEISEEVREEARRLFREGRRLYQDDRSEEALDLLRRSYELMPHWATLNGIALCEEKLEDMVGALRSYERSIREGGIEVPAEQRAQIEQRIAELRRNLGMALLAVVTDPPGAVLEIDGEAAGTAPFEGSVEARTVRLTVRLDGYEPAERTVTLAVGESRTIDLALAARDVLSTAGVLRVETDVPGATVFLDGASAGTTPWESGPLAEGEHRVRVETDGRTWEEPVLVASGRLSRLTVRFGDDGIHPGWFWGTAAVAAAAGIGFAASGGYLSTLHAEYEGADPARRDEIRPTGETLLDVADALLGVAAVTAAAALVLALFTDFDGRPPSEFVVEPNREETPDATALLPFLVTP